MGLFFLVTKLGLVIPANQALLGDRNKAELCGQTLPSRAWQRAKQEFGWRLGQFRQVGQRHAYPLRLVQAQPLTRSRAVVIGNAAHTLHPVAGQGFNLGLRDVASLTETIVNSWRNHEDVGSVATLQRYVAWQQPEHQRIINLTDQLIKIFTNTLPPLVIMRNLGLLMIDSLPPVRKQLVQQMAGMKSYPSQLIRGLPSI